LLDGYASERERLEREVSRAREDLSEQAGICERTERYIGLAEDDSQAQAAMRAAATAQEEHQRRRKRLDAAKAALHDVPTEAPTDGMLDFYNELGDAIRGRLAGAGTLAQVNDALRDIFLAFVIETSESPSEHRLRNLARVGLEPERDITITPIISMIFDWNDLPPAEHYSVVEPGERIRPPLRTLSVASSELANAQAFVNNPQVFPPMLIPAVPR
jgi:hypothetical protein